MMDQTILHKLLERREQDGEKIAVHHVKNEQWTTVTWNEYYEQCDSIAHALQDLGVKEGTTVAIFSNTRLEWAICDMAILSLGGITVPIYPSSTPEDIEFILNNSTSSFIICENKQLLQRYLEVKEKCTTIKKAILIDNNLKSEQDHIKLVNLIETGSKLKSKNPNMLPSSIQKRTLSELASIVYTSGTTGTPKGVQILHSNITSEAKDVFAHIGVNESDMSLSFLPFAHILGRVEHWGHVYCGFAMGYAENIDRIRANLQTIRPTFMVAVPRIFEKIYNSMITQAEASATKKKVFYWALGIGKEISRHRVQKTSPSLATLLQYQVAKKLVFNKLAERLGGRLRFSFSGGAPLSREIAEFFHAAGLLILEGYGLTETTAGVFANNTFDYKFGTVGHPIGDVKVKIAGDGEILLKSEKITPGYYKNKEATNEVFKDGWFCTGDIGEIDDRGFLKITDRKKDLIKTAGGKFVAPQKIENLLKLNKYVSNVLIHGDQRKYIVALITLSYENIESYAKENNILYSNKAELVGHKEIQSLMRDWVSEVNQKLASYESIKNFALLKDDFTVESGELTPSLKVKRKLCDKKYKDVLDSLY